MWFNSFSACSFIILAYEKIQKLASFQPMQNSVQFSHSVVSDSLQPHELQHARPPCSSPTPGIHSDSRPLSAEVNLLSSHLPGSRQWLSPSWVSGPGLSAWRGRGAKQDAQDPALAAGRSGCGVLCGGWRAQTRTLACF